MRTSTTVTNIHSTLLIKFIECFLVAFAINDFYQSMVLFPLTVMFGGVNGAILYLRIFGFVLLVAGLLFTVLYPISWFRKENASFINTNKRHVLFQAIIRYWLVLEICNYAFAKILETQFGHDYFRNNSLTKDLSGFDLTWYYFGYSYTLSVIVALMQISGAILLLFHRTVLLGIVILLPIMVNIVLIDVFYGVQTGAIVNAVSFTLALLYLASLFWRDIKALLIKSLTTLSGLSLSKPVKYIFRFIAVGYAFLFIYYFTTTRAPKFLVGKWSIDQLVKNRDTIQATAWLSDSTAWKNIYFEQFSRVTINPNPYVIEPTRALKGLFKYDSSLHDIQLAVNNDTLDFQVNVMDKNHMQWISKNQKDTLQIKLSKIE
jgi:hypothetical protein